MLTDVSIEECYYFTDTKLIDETLTDLTRHDYSDFLLNDFFLGRHNHFDGFHALSF